MKLLLDTHIFIWWRTDTLKPDVRRLIADTANEIYVSSVSIWEIAVKRRLNKISFEGSPYAAIAENGFFEAPLTCADGELAGSFEWDHKDPFDRMLLAQTRRLSASLVTADAEILRTGPKVSVISAL